MRRRHHKRRRFGRRHRRRSHRLTQNTVYRYRFYVDGSQIDCGPGSSTGTVQGAVTQLSTGPVILGVYFQLSDVYNAAGFEGIYDQYKITHVTLHMQPAALLVDNPGGTSPGNTAMIWEANDYDDASVSGFTPATMMEYQNLKWHHTGSNRAIHFSLRPHVAYSLYQGAFTAYGNKVSSWIDCGSPSAQHYGMKIYIEQGTAGYLQSWRVWATYSVQFRNVR